MCDKHGRRDRVRSRRKLILEGSQPFPSWVSVSSSVPVAEGGQCCLGWSRKGQAPSASSLRGPDFLFSHI